MLPAQRATVHLHALERGGRSHNRCVLLLSKEARKMRISVVILANPSLFVMAVLTRRQRRGAEQALVETRLGATRVPPSF